MTDLTEQWKECPIQEDNYYYIKDSNEKVYIDFFWGEGWVDTPDEDIKELLAKVPSYDEWQATEKYNKHLEVDIKEKETQRIELMTRLNDVNNENHALEIENTKLKELLKECQSKLNYCTRETYELQTKISQALGEDK